jgi:hypothetical protein
MRTRMSSTAAALIAVSIYAFASAVSLNTLRGAACPARWMGVAGTACCGGGA